jgi:hypothetical protein
MWINLISTKSDAALAINRVKATVEMEVEPPLWVLWIDNGSKFTAMEFTAYCADGVQCHFTPYTLSGMALLSTTTNLLAMSCSLLKERETCRCASGERWCLPSQQGFYEGPGWQNAI